MSPEKRGRILEAQARKAAKHYRTDPDLLMSDSGDIVEY
jgi:hypothetical protein